MDIMKEVNEKAHPNTVRIDRLRAPSLFDEIKNGKQIEITYYSFLEDTEIFMLVYTERMKTSLQFISLPLSEKIDKNKLIVYENRRTENELKDVKLIKA
uniref:Uncharacterized protein n=1 Tax=Onchocerca volvulus TaxID=6282 RepID=A0A8R1XL32_ONCVO